MKYLFPILLCLVACGPQGPAGPMGPQGGGCTVNSVTPQPAAPNGGTILSCADGSQALILNGTNGTNGTVITPEQLCKNPVSSYPSTFAEIGFCINGTLYGVYSANGGFLTPILSGTWSSDGINASCTFAVSGCTIYNQSN